MPCGSLNYSRYVCCTGYVCKPAKLSDELTWRCMCVCVCACVRACACVCVLQEACSAATWQLPLLWCDDIKLAIATAYLRSLYQSLIVLSTVTTDQWASPPMVL